MNVVSRARDLALLSLVGGWCGRGRRGCAKRWRRLVDQVRAANARFNEVSVAVAEGYAPIPCASGVDGGAMGVHYVNPNYLKDTAVDIKRPQAVMYEPTPDGKMALVAVEYITFKGPAVAGRPAVQLQRRAQPLRPRSLLRTARVGLEVEPARPVRRHEP